MNEKLITKIIFGREDISNIELPVKDENKQNFEIAWDIWKNFKQIKEKIIGNFFRELEKEIKNIIKDDELFFVSYNDILYGSVYVSKEDWMHQNADKRGIISLCIEKYDRDLPSIGIVKDQPFKISDDLQKKIESYLVDKKLKPTTTWFVGYLPINDWSYDNKSFHIELLSNIRNSIKDKLIEDFKGVFEIVTKDEEFLSLLEDVVQERKSNLNKNHNPE